MPRLRVLSVFNHMVSGGIEVMLLRCLPHLQRLGCDISVCCLQQGGNLTKQFEDQGCPIYYIGKHVNPYQTASRIKSLLIEKPHSVVHSNMAYTSGGIVRGAYMAQTPSIVSFHNSRPTALYENQNSIIRSKLISALLSWHRHLMERNASLFVGHSQTNIQAYKPDWALSPDRYRVIYNGIPSPSELPDSLEAKKRLSLPDKFTLIHIGSFTKQKNHVGLLHIFSRVLKARPDAQLILVGAGELDSVIRKTATDLQIIDHILFVGRQSDIWTYLAAADVFVFPSEIEGFGNVLVEAQLAGLPVVASDIPPHRESVAPCHHEYLFPLPNYDQAAEYVLQQIHCDSDQISAAKNYAAENFSIERMADTLVRTYQEIADRPMS